MFAPLPQRPTRYPPGSAEKVRVLRNRYRRGEQLFHPQDVRGSVYQRPQRKARSFVFAYRFRGSWHVFHEWAPGRRKLLGKFGTKAEALALRNKVRKALASGQQPAEVA